MSCHRVDSDDEIERAHYSCVVERIMSSGDRSELAIPTSAQRIALQEVPVDLLQLRESLNLIKRNRTRLR